MNYLKYRFEVQAGEKEILLAFLSSFSFDAFDETESELGAYLPEDAQSEELQKQISEIAEKRAVNFQIEKIPAQNWNKEWESNFQPIIVDSLVTVRADFHPSAQGTRYEIIINPKMAFGTGHHETTYMMLQEMDKHSFKEAKVLDYGCGTGILAIMAVKLGAKKVFAFDIQEEAWQNSVENVAVNEVAGSIDLAQGTLELAKGEKYQRILANINRKVILESLDSLYEMLEDEGVLLISGILEQDGILLEQKLTKARFVMVNKRMRNKWLCLTLKKL